MSRREELLDIADRLWRSRGYAGFSFADLSAASGIRKASVHHHFPSKAALGEALIARHAASAQAFAAAVAGDATAAVEAFLDHYERLLEAPEEVCAASAVCADLMVLPDDVAMSGRAYLAGQRAWLVAQLAAGPWQGDPDGLADVVLGMLQGGLQRARAEGEPERLRGAIRALRQLLEHAR
jgi:TetR/AcrR family transcriptional repressor of nem operon